MRAGIDIKENNLLYTIACVKCRGTLAFPASVSNTDAVTKAKTRHGWKVENNKLYCDGCSDMLEVDKPKLKKTVKKEAPKPPDDDDDCIEL